MQHLTIKTSAKHASLQSMHHYILHHSTHEKLQWKPQTLNPKPLNPTCNRLLIRKKLSRKVVELWVHAQFGWRSLWTQRSCSSSLTESGVLLPNHLLFHMHFFSTENLPLQIAISADYNSCIPSYTWHPVVLQQQNSLLIVALLLKLGYCDMTQNTHWLKFWCIP